MTIRPAYPTIYEIDTWTWLADLSTRTGASVDLGNVPSGEWDALAARGFDAVWLMGVWERSPLGTAIANGNPGLQEDFRRALPDFRPEDNVGSPYCIRNYAVDGALGGPAALAHARAELARRGLKLILDFVPNHVAPDHRWVADQPDCFIRGTAADARDDSASFMTIDGRVYARGRDPYFPAWPDVLQLNAFAPALRQAAIATLTAIAAQCDGVRCDMAMLMLNAVFARTWGERAGPVPATDYWREVIPAVHRAHPGFLFIAEAYWDLEWELQQQGFDFCYDKRLYDRLVHGDAAAVRGHLCAELAYQAKLLRFIENHDEPRAAAEFAPAKARAAAVAIATLPGARLFHDGQFEGRRVRMPVFLGRRAEEAADAELTAFYDALLRAIDRPVFHDGEWRLCAANGWPDNRTCEQIVAWAWRDEHDRYVVMVNLGDRAAQARVRVPWDDLSGRTWQLTDVLATARYERNGDEMADPGLYVELAPWGSHFFHLQPLPA